MASTKTFWNREAELKQIRNQLGKSGFGYVTGRRRVGKTALLTRASETFDGLYHQAVEGTPEQQLMHLAEEISDRLPIFQEITPKSWNEFFHLLSREKLPKLLIFDEFPYWIEGDTTLASLFQKWTDHGLSKTKTSLIVSGSSQSMLYSKFLQQKSPLYGRASFHIHLEQMNYAWFCRALKYKFEDPASFTRFSLVGGVPHYWKLMPKGSVTHQAQELYFTPSAILAQEPIQWIRDEGITGTLPKALLDLIGRGVRKPSELASRLATAQGNLSRPLALLLHLGLVNRDLPYGESVRSTKKVLYSIQDAALSFYYGTFLIHRMRWEQYTKNAQMRLLEQHTSQQWEIFCRSMHTGSSRYWEGNIEIDLIAPVKDKRQIIVAECKWSVLEPKAERKRLENLKSRFFATKLYRKLCKEKKIIFKIYSKKDLRKFVKQ